MSRSNPTDTAVNPAVRWFEWQGEHGIVRYYDKEKKENVDVGADFGFVLLDQLASVRGWHEASQSGIYSNEVKDTRADVLVVKAFKGGTLAEGLYKDIKDRANNVGGRFNANIYLAFKHGPGMAIGCLRLKGGALGAWMEFVKANRAEVYKQAIKITGFTEGKKGRVVFRVPQFKLVPLAPESNEKATALDAELQAFLEIYLKRTKKQQAEHVAQVVPDVEDADDSLHGYDTAPTDDDITW